MTGRQSNFNPTDDYIARFMGEEPLPPPEPEGSSEPQTSAPASPDPADSLSSPWDAPTSATSPVPPNAFPPATPTSPPPSAPVPESTEARSPQAGFPFAQEEPEYTGSPAMQDAMDANSLNTPPESAAMQDAIDANLRDPNRTESLAADPTFPAASDVPGEDPTGPTAANVPSGDLASGTQGQPQMQPTELTLPPAVPFVPTRADRPEAIASAMADSTNAEPPAAPSPQELMQQLTRYQQQYGEDATQDLLAQVLIDFERRYGVSGTRELLLNVIEDLELQQGPAAAASVVSNLPEVESGPPVQPIYPTAVVDFPDPQAQPAQPPPPVVERELRSVPAPTATGNSTRQNLINLLPLALVAAIAGTALAFTLLNRGQSRPEATQMAQAQLNTTQDIDSPAQGAIAGWDDMSTRVSQVLDQISGSPSSPANPEPAPEVIEPSLPAPLPDIEPEEPLEPPYDPSIPNPNLSPTPAPTLSPSTPYPPVTPLPGTQLW